LFIVAPKPYCEDSFEGGGWALVRRVKSGSTWHPATDNLLGSAEYGNAGVSNTADTTFSLPFSSYVTSESLFLLASGKNMADPKYTL
jgi:hypothetical protein